MSDIGIIIRTFNEEAYIGKTLDAIMEQTEQDFKIVIVDSGSVDGTVNIVNKYDDVVVVNLLKNEFTYGKALNIGIKYVSGYAKYVVLLSAHAIPCDCNWLKNLIEPLINSNNIVGVYGKQKPLPDHLTNPIVRVLEVDGYAKCYGDNYFTTAISPFFSNANCAIKMEGWKLARFDECLKGSEDWQWANKMLSLGYQLAYQPLASVYHSHQDTYFQFYKRRRNEEAGMRVVDPVSYPIISRSELIKSLVKIGWAYFHGVMGMGNIKGRHADKFAYQIFSTLAAYKGRNQL